MPTLTKPCKCRWCKQPMAVGDAFKWVKAKRPAHGFVKGSATGTVGMVDTWRPAHDFDCLSDKIAAERAAYIDEQCKMLSGLGASDEKIAEYRAHMETRR